MSAELTLLLLLLILAAFYWVRWRPAQRVLAPAPQEPAQEPASAFAAPAGYCFHPGHTWMAEQGHAVARVGIDALAVRLLGKVERIAVLGEQRWVRQGQKLITLIGGGELVEMLSPLEGVVTAINPQVIQNPEWLLRDPYGEGWVCAMKSPEMETNRRNLVLEASSSGWMRHSLRRLTSLLGEADPQLAQDGGQPAAGLLARLSPGLRRRVVKEFFLT